MTRAALAPGGDPASIAAIAAEETAAGGEVVAVGRLVIAMRRRVTVLAVRVVTVVRPNHGRVVRTSHTTNPLAIARISLARCWGALAGNFDRRACAREVDAFPDKSESFGADRQAADSPGRLTAT